MFLFTRRGEIMPSINLEMDDVKIVITALANYLSDIAETGQAMTANNKERAKALFESGKRVDSLMKKITAMALKDMYDPQKHLFCHLEPVWCLACCVLFKNMGVGRGCQNFRKFAIFSQINQELFPTLK